MFRSLPGGMSYPAAMRLVLSRRPMALMPTWLRPILAALATSLGVWLLDRFVLRLGLPFFLVIPLAVLVAVVVFAVGPTATPSAGDELVHPRDQPRLHALVAGVAEQLGIPKPARIWLWAVPNSVARRPVPWRSELWLGLPFATEMPAEELRAIVACELTLAECRRSWVLNALCQIWEDEVSRIKPGKDSPKPFVVTIATVVQAARSAADKAAVRTAGVEAFASALVRGTAIAFTFQRFAARYAVPVSWLRRFPADLYSGWRWKLRDDGWLKRGWPLFRGPVLEDPRPACSLAERLSALGGQADLTPPSGERAPLPSGLPTEVEERFSLWYVSRYATQTPPRGYVPAGPTRFRDVPPDIWDHVVRAQMEEVLTATAGLLGKRAATTKDVVQVVHDGRVGELEWPHKEWTCAHASSGVRALFPVIHHGLRTAGYRYNHPLRQRELVGPDGDHIDVTILAERVEQGESLPPHLHTALDADGK